MMESMSEQQTLYNEALNSTGALEEANSVKAESVEGKLNTLKDTVKEMWSNFIDSDAIKDYKKFNAFIQTDLGKEFLELKKKELEKKSNE